VASHMASVLPVHWTVNDIYTFVLCIAIGNCWKKQKIWDMARFIQENDSDENC